MHAVVIIHPSLLVFRDAKINAKIVAAFISRVYKQSSRLNTLCPINVCLARLLTRQTKHNISLCAKSVTKNNKQVTNLNKIMPQVNNLKLSLHVVLSQIE